MAEAERTYSERHPAGIDMDAAKRAAVRECRSAYQLIIHQGARHALRLRRAVYRLAIAIGNQSIAEEFLADADAPRTWDMSIARDRAHFFGPNSEAARDTAERERDAAELQRGVDRSDPHPELMATLRQIEDRIAAEDRASR